ncbi:MAG: M23 family metallopeptidase [Spirochaetes bacterium]|nr:M23 family metallopeptidase [Spirochaetota bacterium]MBX3723615.1 M23 family metallopeptidase [Turneriella sp.]
MTERAQALMKETEVEIDNRLIQTYQGYAGVWTNITSTASIKRTCKEDMCDPVLFRLVNELNPSQNHIKKAGLYFVPFINKYLDRLKDSGIFRQKVTLKKGQYVWPVMGIRITSRVGNRWGKIHGGIDVAASRGSIVVGATDGTVMLIGDQGAYGHCVFVENHDGTVAWYAHLTDSYVKVGDKIVRGQIVGSSGNTGRSTGPHLHFEMRTQQGIILDPEHFFVLPFEEHLKHAQDFENETATRNKQAKVKPSN